MYQQEVAITRLGLHLNALTDASRRLALGYPWAVVKVLGIWDEGFLAQLKAQNPKVVIVGRNWYGTQDFDVDAAVAPILGTSPRIRQLVDYWETYNEVLGGDNGNAQRFADFSVAVANRLHQAGLKYCALSLAVGTPAGNDDQIKQTLGILWPAVATADAWSYHAYGAPQVLSDPKWYALRYRHLIELDPRYATKPLILSELGQDYGILPGQHGGYLAHQVSFADYAAQLRAADAELQGDAYVIGGAIYQAGDETPWNAATDSGQTWGSFCLTDQVAQAVFQGEPVATTDYAKATWAQAACWGDPDTGQQIAGRKGYAVKGVVLHGTAGPGAVSWFQNPVSQVSAHYVVDTDGSVTQCVREDDIAWAEGIVTPDSKFYGGPNPNLEFISIEHTRDRTNTSPIAPAQLAASIDLIKDIFRRRGAMPLYTHDQIEVGRVCPGPGFPLEQIVAAVTPSAESAQDPDLAYFGMLGHTPNPDSALWKYALKPLRDFYLQLKMQNHPMADLVNPGPATGPEYTVVVNGVTAYRINLTNRVLETKCVNGQWQVFQAEVLK